MTLTIPSDLDMAELDVLQTTMQVTLNLQGVCYIIVRAPSTLKITVFIHSTIVQAHECDHGCDHLYT